MKRYYLQVRPDGIITDAITYPFEDYKPVDLDYLPDGIYGGWYKLVDGKIVEFPDLKPKPEPTQSELEKRIEMTEEAINFLLMGGM